MGYSYVFLGDLSFPSATECAAWAASTLDGTAFDTPDDWGTDDHGTAGDALDAFAGELSRVERGDATIKLRAIVDKSGDEWLTYRGSLACAFRAAASFGGNGELVVVGYEDYPGEYGVRVRVEGGRSTFEELDEDEIRAVEETPAYREADAIVAASLPPHDDLLAKVEAMKAKEREEAARIASEPDMDRVFAMLDATLPTMATFMEKSSLPESPAVRALVARKQPGTDERMRARLAQLVEGAFASAGWTRQLDMKDQVLAAALAHALFDRGQAHDEILAMWIESPLWFLRDHARALALKRHEHDVRLASFLGKKQSAEAWNEDNHRWIVDALLASDPEGAPARAIELLKPDLRRRSASLESLRWIVSAMYSRPELNIPPWHDFLRAVIAYEPRSPASDLFDQIRDSAIGVTAVWKMPEALDLVREHFDALGVERGCELLVVLGDPAATTVLEDALARTKRKPDRTRIEKAIAALGGNVAATESAGEASSGHRIEVSPSGRAACRGCKQKIAKGELRFGEETRNVFSDSGEASFRYWHLKCAAEKKPKLFGPTLVAYAGEIPDRASLTQIVEAASAKRPRAKK